MKTYVLIAPAAVMCADSTRKTVTLITYPYLIKKLSCRQACYKPCLSVTKLRESDKDYFSH